MQIYKTGVFKRYDYGYVLNLIRYRRFSPPKYEIGQITTPIVIIRGKNDVFSNSKVSALIRNK